MPAVLSQHIQKINYTVQGEGQPVILIHGIAASLFDWVELAPQLARSGYSTYALDLLGHGESPHPEEHDHYHFDSLYAHLEAWIESLDLRLPTFLVGHSLGGSLCLHYALHHPENVQGMVLLDPFYSLTQLSPALRLLNRRPHLGEKALRLAPLWLIHALTRFDPGSPDCSLGRNRQQIAADYKRASPKIAHIVRTIPDMEPFLSRMNAHILVIWGEKDITLVPQSFPHLVKKMPNAAGQAIPSCGHQPHLGQPALVNRLILAFLEEHTDLTTRPDLLMRKPGGSLLPSVDGSQPSR